ncbi:MAG: TetR family transcriptional regulator [Acidimicrobiales bacterium]|jgi:AcrR family transcriptional regulator|nr:TetR family transcriptional regulator [Acidimicrobiales bacterium]
MAKQRTDTLDAGPATDAEDPRLVRLLSAARRAAGKGYEAVSMRELAAETRMSLSTIYELVGSKDELIAMAHAGGMERLREELAMRPPRGATPEARVRAVVRRLADSLEHDEVRTRALMRALYSPEPRIRTSIESVGGSFGAIIDAAIGDAEIPDRDDVVDLLGHVVNSVIVSWLNGRLDVAGVRRKLDRAVHTVLGRG